MISAAPSTEPVTPGPVLAPRTASFRTPEDTTLAVDASRLPGDGASGTAGSHATLTADVGHGQLDLASDGSFTYRPSPRYVGSDSFGYLLTVQGRPSIMIVVTLAIYRADEPSASPGDAFLIGSMDRGGSSLPDVTFGSLGPLSFAFVWLIPSLVISVPGFLILILLSAQLVAGAAWLPFVRRDVGDFGLGSRPRRSGGAQP